MAAVTESDEAGKEIKSLDSDEENDDIIPQTRTREIITLNVGGTKYQTTKATLLSIKQGVLYKMFQGTFNDKPLEDGAYFIDRDATYFRYILNFLRDGIITIDVEDKKTMIELLTEARFYQIYPNILA